MRNEYSTEPELLKLRLATEVKDGREVVYRNKGETNVEKSLELRPDAAGALEARGLIFEALGRKQEAVADFRRGRARRPNRQISKDALKRLGALGRFEVPSLRTGIIQAGQRMTAFHRGWC